MSSNMQKHLLATLMETEVASMLYKPSAGAPRTTVGQMSSTIGGKKLDKRKKRNKTAKKQRRINRK